MKRISNLCQVGSLLPAPHTDPYRTVYLEPTVAFLRHAPSEPYMVLGTHSSKVIDGSPNVRRGGRGTCGVGGPATRTLVQPNRKMLRQSVMPKGTQLGKKMRRPEPGMVPPRSWTPTTVCGFPF